MLMPMNLEWAHMGVIRCLKSYLHRASVAAGLAILEAHLIADGRLR